MPRQCCGQDIRLPLSTEVSAAPVLTRCYSCYLGPVPIVLEETAGVLVMTSRVVLPSGRTLVCTVIDAQEHRLDPVNFVYPLDRLQSLSPARLSSQTNRIIYFFTLFVRLQLSKINNTSVEGLRVLQFIQQDPLPAESEETRRTVLTQALHEFGHIEAILGLWGITSKTQTISEQTLVGAYHALLKHNVCIDALFNMVEYLHFLKAMFGHVLQATPGNHLLAVVNVPRFDNAYTTGTYFVAGNGSTLMFPLVSIDVMGHEITHGLVQRRAGLRYRGHSGALNESFCDIFGCALEFYLYKKYDLLGRPDFLIGEDVGKAWPFLRNLEHPAHGATSQPARYRGRQWRNPNRHDRDHGHVHTNSGVWNRCFFLCVQKYGLRRSLRWFLKVLNNLKPGSDYLHARDLLRHFSNNRRGVRKILKRVGLRPQAVSDERIRFRRPPLPKRSFYQKFSPPSRKNTGNHLDGRLVCKSRTSTRRSG